MTRRIRCRWKCKILLCLICIFHHALLIESLPRWLTSRLSILKIAAVKWRREHHRIRVINNKRLFKSSKPFLIKCWIKSFQLRSCRQQYTLVVRGGDTLDNEGHAGVDDEYEDEETNPVSLEPASEPQKTPEIPSNDMVTKSRRHTSDIIQDLCYRSNLGSNDVESLALRELIMTRTADYILELKEAVQANDPKLPHPRKLLHYLAPKVPAIKHSPDVSLRIHSSRSDIDPGIAACILGSVAYVTELYDKEMLLRSSRSSTGTEEENDDRHTDNIGKGQQSIAPELTSDRRFEQLVECVLCGVDVKKRLRESLQRQVDKATDEAADIEEVLDEEEVTVDEGLNIRDACRAAWGLAVIGAHRLDKLGLVKVADLLLALSLRIRELLLARLMILRKDDILAIDDEIPENESSLSRKITTEERLSELSEELAEDVASAMWAFGVVKACTGIRSAPLFEVCCGLLCSDPVDLRRRSQEDDYKSSDPTIGCSDVVDRLALSDDNADINNNVTTSKDSNLMDVEKDVLLSWLSPREVNDVLWALALHGSNSTSTKDEIILSATASTLREVAYDRIGEWLQLDLQNLQEMASNIRAETILAEQADETVTFEVVDATALITAEEKNLAQAKTERHIVPRENVTVKTNTVADQEMATQKVEVVDAAKLLASAHGEVEVESEIIVAPVPIVETNTILSSGEIETTKTDPRPLNFSPHELATIAYSVTELQDPLKDQIVGIIVDIFSELGPDSLLLLPGVDLSNLAWAIAKSHGELKPNMAVQWIAERVYLHSESLDILKILQAPELGRIMWSLSVASTNDKDKSPKFMLLARKALIAAAKNISLFSTEDLVRISWAFLELAGSDLELECLGQIVSTIEISLIRWERGDCFQVKSPETHGIFSSFFGRPKNNMPILDQTLDHDDELFVEKLKRPKLRELTVDPSSLIKLACNFQRLASENPSIQGSWTMTKVALRLLSSNHGRLMKECGFPDIVRLCLAAVNSSDIDGHGREIVIGLFTRRLVEMLNEVLDDNSNSEYFSEIHSATSPQIATLIYALGELGVKHGDVADLVNKKLRLVYLDPLLSKLEMEYLNRKQLHQLIRGLVQMKAASKYQNYVLCALKRIESELSNATITGDEFCSLAESIGLLKQFMQANSGSKQDETSTLSEDTSISDKDGKLVDEQLADVTDNVLNSIAELAKTRSKTLTARQLCCILEIYSLLPFRADRMIDVFEDEVSCRLAHLKDITSAPSFNTLLNNAQEKNDDVKAALFEENRSVFNTIKNGILGLFGSTNDNDNREESSAEGQNNTEAVLAIIHESMSASFDVIHRRQADEAALKISFDQMLQSHHQDALFELGRSKALIAHYRRVDHDTGTVRSRYDDRRNDIAKRVLSLLLP